MHSRSKDWKIDHAHSRYIGFPVTRHSTNRASKVSGRCTLCTAPVPGCRPCSEKTTKSGAKPGRVAHRQAVCKLAGGRCPHGDRQQAFTSGESTHMHPARGHASHASNPSNTGVACHCSCRPVRTAWHLRIHLPAGAPQLFGKVEVLCSLLISNCVRMYT